MTDPEPFRSRWSRRARTIPIMLGATLIALLLSPLLVPVAAVADLARRRRRLPMLRVYLFLLQYGINDSVEILLAPVYWALAGFGTSLGGAASVARHQRLQQWSIDLLARRAEQLLGLRVEVDTATLDALHPGPVIVLCRHVSLFDASLPSVLCHRVGLRSRGVIMAELLADPGFDLIYRRTGSVFVPRDNGPEARAMLADLGHGVHADTAVVIFPEGRLFRPDRLARSMTRMAEQHPDRAAHLAPLTHCLPPRPGGVLALLDALPGTDVVVVAHAGLDGYPSVVDLARAVPVASPIEVTAWRVAADDIPTDDLARLHWLDEQWLRVDTWVGRATPG